MSWNACPARLYDCRKSFASDAEAIEWMKSFDFNACSYSLTIRCRYNREVSEINGVSAYYYEPSDSYFFVNRGIDNGVIQICLGEIKSELKK